MNTPTHIASLTLPIVLADDCALLGIVPHADIKATRLYIEQYMPQDWVQQTILTAAGDVIQQADDRDDGPLLTLPDDRIAPEQPFKHALQFKGLRYRGLSEEDRIADWVQGLTIMEKMPLASKLNLTVPPPMILGLAESYILSIAHLDDTGQTVVCRRIRLAYRLPQRQIDADGLPYDYDTRVVFIAHPYHVPTDTAPALHDCIGSFADVAVQRPTACIAHDNRLYLLDCGAADDPQTHPARLHIWRIDAA